jgi:hypothetical protein
VSNDVYEKRTVARVRILRHDGEVQAALLVLSRMASQWMSAIVAS